MINVSKKEKEPKVIKIPYLPFVMLNRLAEIRRREKGGEKIKIVKCGTCGRTYEVHGGIDKSNKCPLCVLGDLCEVNEKGERHVEDVEEYKRTYGDRKDAPGAK